MIIILYLIYYYFSGNESFKTLIINIILNSRVVFIDLIIKVSGPNKTRLANLMSGSIGTFYYIVRDHLTACGPAKHIIITAAVRFFNL